MSLLHHLIHMSLLWITSLAMAIQHPHNHNAKAILGDKLFIKHLCADSLDKYSFQYGKPLATLRPCIYNYKFKITYIYFIIYAIL